MKLSLSENICRLRKEKGLTQAQLADATGINRAMIGRIENKDYVPTVKQMQTLGETLGFEVVDMFVSDEADVKKEKSDIRITVGKSYNIAVAGTGYVGLSLATLLAQHNHVVAVDIVQEKVDMINQHISPIQDDYIEKYLAEKELDLTATLDGASAYAKADFVIIAAPTNYDSKKNFFDTSAVEAVIDKVLAVNPDAVMVIKSTIPVGFTAMVREKYNCDNIVFAYQHLLN